MFTSVVPTPRALVALLVASALLLALPALAQQPAPPAQASSDEAPRLRQNGIFDAESLEVMREERRVMIETQRAERDARREMMRNNPDHPALRAGVEARRTHMERLSKLDRIKQIGEQNNDQALIDRALAARDLELRRYFMWRTFHRATAGNFGESIPQSDNAGE